jgi:hypothetical protein
MSKLVLLVVAVVLVSLALEIQSAKMTNKIRKGVLKSQNKVRSNVAKGKTANGTTGTKLPKAANIYQLSYSKKLEKKALKLAKLCSANVTAGSIIYVGEGEAKNAAALKNASKTWASEVTTNGLASLTYNASNSTTGNFTQLIWAKSSQVGCGVAACTNVTGVSGSATSYTVVVCSYKKAGNVDGQAIYKKGKKQKCPKGSKAVKKTRLCKVKGKKGKAIHK